MGIRETARALGVNPGTAARWHKRGMPLEPEAAQRWREQHGRLRVKPGPAAAPMGPAPVESFSVARAKREAALAHLAELDLAERRGELVRGDEVERVVALACSNARDLLLGLPARAAPATPGLDAKAVQALLEAEVHYVLEQLAEGLFRASKPATTKGTR